MKIIINDVNFFIDLLTRHKETLYTRMRFCKYPMKDILSFLNGVTFVEDRCSIYVMNNIVQDFDDVLFTNYDEVNEALEKTFMHKNTIKQASKWEEIGIKYAVCLIKFYMEHVVFGTYNIVNTSGLYLDLPDKNDPDSYDWKLHGWDI